MLANSVGASPRGHAPTSVLLSLSALLRVLDDAAAVARPAVPAQQLSDSAPTGQQLMVGPLPGPLLPEGVPVAIAPWWTSGVPGLSFS